jgi:hypothetical protein
MQTPGRANGVLGEPILKNRHRRFVPKRQGDNATETDLHVGSVTAVSAPLAPHVNADHLLLAAKRRTTSKMDSEQRSTTASTASCSCCSSCTWDRCGPKDADNEDSSQQWSSISAAQASQRPQQARGALCGIPGSKSAAPYQGKPAQSQPCWRTGGAFAEVLQKFRRSTRELGSLTGTRAYQCTPQTNAVSGGRQTSHVRAKPAARKRSEMPSQLANLLPQEPPRKSAHRPDPQNAPTSPKQQNRCTQTQSI